MDVQKYITPEAARKRKATTDIKYSEQFAVGSKELKRQIKKAHKKLVKKGLI